MKLPLVIMVLVDGSDGVSTLALPMPLINSWPNWVAEAAPLRSTLTATMSLVRPASSRVAR
jgi:hypothetical protein